jgi:DNA replication protein DnaC
LALRHERRLIIISSNLGFADWVQIFGEPTLTAARLDRLTQRAHMVTCDWESLRLQESLKTKSGAKEKTEAASPGR